MFVLKLSGIQSIFSSLEKESLLENESKANEVPVQCFPLYSLLLVVGNPTVNYMRLV